MRIRGFTIVEVLVSVAIIGILGGLTLAISGQMRPRAVAGRDMHNAGKHLAAMLTKARTAAITHHTNVAVVYDWDMNDPDSVIPILDTLNNDAARMFHAAAIVYEFPPRSGLYVPASNAEGFEPFGHISGIVMRYPEPDSGHYALGRAYNDMLANGVNPADITDNMLMVATEIGDAGMSVVRVTANEAEIIAALRAARLDDDNDIVALARQISDSVTDLGVYPNRDARFAGHVFTPMSRIVMTRERVGIMVAPGPELGPEGYLDWPDVLALTREGKDGHLVSNLRHVAIDVYRATGRIRAR